MSALPAEKRYELEKRGEKSTILAILLGFFLSPLAYVYVGKPLLAIVNFITLNYFLLGLIIVPIHSRKVIKDARREVSAAEAV